MPLPLLAALGSAAASGAAAAGSAVASGAGAAAGMAARGAAAVGRGAGAAGGQAAKMAKQSLGIQKKQKQTGDDTKKGITGKRKSLLAFASAQARSSSLISGFFKDTMSIIGMFVNALIAPIMPYLYKGLGWVAKGIPFVMKWSQKIFDWIVQGFKWFFVDLPGIIWDFAKKIPGYITDGAVWLWDTMKEWYETAKTAITGAFDTVVDWIKGIGENVWEKIKTGFNWLIDSLKTGFLFVWDLIDGPILGVITKVRDWIKSAWDFLSKDLPSIISGVFSWVWDKIKDIANSLFSFDWLRNAIATVVGFIGDILRGLNKVFGISGKLDGAISSIDAAEKRIRGEKTKLIGPVRPDTPFEIKITTDTGQTTETFKSSASARAIFEHQVQTNQENERSGFNDFMFAN
tara:strand:- start:1481 stop:2689 length:1209 start_codon:yes stop_codon:yes gene_type:complete